MKHRKLKTCAVLLLGLGLQATQAQTALFVKQKVGINTPFNLSTLKSITFDGSNVTVNKKDASTSSFVRTNVQYMNFGINTDIDQINGTVNSKLKIFPNPVIDVLNIAYSETISQLIQIEIIGIDGKVALHSTLYNSVNSFSVATLPKGLYLLRCNNGTNIISTKFIKQ
jgi:hypothetical protein